MVEHVKDTEEEQEEKPEPKRPLYTDKYWYRDGTINTGEYPDHEY
jgi:hypothetical protein